MLTATCTTPTCSEHGIAKAAVGQLPAGTPPPAAVLCGECGRPCDVAGDWPTGDDRHGLDRTSHPPQSPDGS